MPEFPTYRERYTEQLAIRVPVGLRATVEAHAKKEGVPRSEMFRRLLVAGLELEDARRSYAEQGTLEDYLNDVLQRDPASPHGSWGWVLAEDGPAPATPEWLRVLEGPA